MIFHNSLHIKWLTTIIQNQLLIRVQCSTCHVFASQRSLYQTTLKKSIAASITRIIDCEQSLIFPCKVTARGTQASEGQAAMSEPRAASREKRGRNLNPLALDEIRTRGFLREKADCKQSTRIMVFAT